MLSCSEANLTLQIHEAMAFCLSCLFIEMNMVRAVTDLVNYLIYNHDCKHDSSSSVAQSSTSVYGN